MSEAEKKYYAVIKDLRRDNNIIISKPDKGKGVVISNKEDYVRKMNYIINATNKFKKIDSDWLKTIIEQEDK